MTEVVCPPLTRGQGRYAAGPAVPAGILDNRSTAGTSR
jgi:hypothetical protein